MARLPSKYLGNSFEGIPSWVVQGYQMQKQRVHSDDPLSAAVKVSICFVPSSPTTFDTFNFTIVSPVSSKLEILSRGPFVFQISNSRISRHSVIGSRLKACTRAYKVPIDLSNDKVSLCRLKRSNQALSATSFPN